MSVVSAAVSALAVEDLSVESVSYTHLDVYKRQQYVSAATIIQQQLAPLNIKVTIDQQDNATYTSLFEAFNYDAMINGATNDISDPDEMASFQVDVEDGGSHSFWTYYDNPAAIKLVREAEVATDGATRKSLYEQIQAIVAQDAPFIALDLSLIHI